MAIWEWQRSISLEKQLEVRNDGLDDEFEYGEVHTLDLVQPQTQQTFTAEGFTWEEVSAIVAIAKTAGATYEIEDHLGQSWSGPIKSVKADPIPGTIYWSMTLTLLEPLIVEEEE